MRGWPVVGAAVAAVAVAGCAGSASNPPCAASGCTGVIGTVRACDQPSSRRCHPVTVASVAVLDGDGQVVRRSGTAVGDDPSSQFEFKGLNPGPYTLRTRARGRSWTSSFQGPINVIVHTDITIRPG
jgi:hypothetical protein